MSNQVQITVCICTYNRAGSLAQTLASLSEQTGIDELDWELLLIDNNSADETARVAEDFNTCLPLHYIFEPIQGLSAARNRALNDHQGKLLIFTDDDARLGTDWLEAWVQAEREFPNAMYFGGRILPLWEDSRPSWLADPSLSLIAGLLVHYDLGSKNRWFEEKDPPPFGANFAVRRNLVEQLKPFRLDLGVRGGKPGRGEEAEYLGRARAAGHRGAYIGAAVCYHVQDARRFSLHYLYKYGIEKGRAKLLMGDTLKGSRHAQLAYALKGLAQLVRGRGDRFRQCVINIGIQSGLMADTSSEANES